MIESAFNRLLRFDSSGPITRRDESDSKSRSEFESYFEFDRKLVEFYRKLVEFEPNLPIFDVFGRFWFKFDQNQSIFD